MFFALRAGTFGGDLIMSYQHGWKGGWRNNLLSHGSVAVLADVCASFGPHSDDVEASTVYCFFLQAQIKEECHLMPQLKLVISV